MPYDDPVPPILAQPGMRLIAMGRTDNGHAWLKFGATRGRIREVTVFVVTDQPTTWEYRYAVYEPTTRTVVTYEGRHGDPARDRRLDIRGTE